MSDHHDLRALAERAARECIKCPACGNTGERPFLDGPVACACAGVTETIADAIERVATEHARQAVEAEREACAAVADTHYIGSTMTGDYRYCCPVDEKIRARGGKA